MKKILTLLFMAVFLLSFTSALTNLGNFEKEENIRISQICSDATYITISSITFPNSTIAISPTNMTSIGSGEFYHFFNSTDSLGRYDVRGVSDGCERTFATYFEVTNNGETLDSVKLISRIFLILLCIALIIFIQVSRKRINHDKWFNQITTKYQDKNWVKFSLAAIGYNFLKNSYVFSYLVGLLGLLILTDLTYFFNVTSALEIMKIVLAVYSWAAIAVVLIFVSQVQEWAVEWLKDLQDIKWGVEK